jgi:hypothetical protein
VYTRVDEGPRADDGRSDPKAAIGRLSRCARCRLVHRNNALHQRGEPTRQTQLAAAMRNTRLREDADNETAAATRMIQSVSISVAGISAIVANAIATVRGSVKASRAKGITAASNRPALASTTVCSTPLTRGCCILRPTKCTSGIINRAGVIIAAHNRTRYAGNEITDADDVETHWAGRASRDDDGLVQLFVRQYVIVED